MYSVLLDMHALYDLCVRWSVSGQLQFRLLYNWYIAVYTVQTTKISNEDVELCSSFSIVGLFLSGTDTAVRCRRSKTRLRLDTK